MADPQSIPLSAAQRSKIRRLSQPKEPALGEEAGELNIVPYLDIIVNILVFVLASVSVTFVASIDTQPPSIGGGKVRADVSSKALNLSCFITNQGISLKTSSGNIATGCRDVGSGVTVPISGDGSYDFTAVTSCAKELKNARPEFLEEVQVTITANPGIEYGTIISAMDALRSDGQQELFPEVFFGVAR
jgi:biopolymer transport protein TolR